MSTRLLVGLALLFCSSPPVAGQNGNMSQLVDSESETWKVDVSIVDLFKFVPHNETARYEKCVFNGVKDWSILHGAKNVVPDTTGNRIHAELVSSPSDSGFYMSASIAYMVIENEIVNLDLISQKNATITPSDQIYVCKALRELFGSL